jgi:hypothetical protein
MNESRSHRTHLTPTLDTVECQHCGEAVADRPFPPPEDDAAWSAEATAHRLGCAAVLSRGGTRAALVAPTWARGHEYHNGDPAWFTRPERGY